MPVMKNDNDLHGNRVVRSDDNNSNQSTAGTEQYRASRKEQEKESAKQAVQKSGKSVGAAVGAYVGGSAGAKIGAEVGDRIAKSKIGKRVGDNLSKNPLARKVLAKANDSGALDKANKATDVLTSLPGEGGGAGEAANAAKAGEAGEAAKVGDVAKDSGDTLNPPKKTPSKPDFLGEEDNQEEKPGSSIFEGIISGKLAVKIGIVSMAAFFLLILLFFIGIGQSSGTLSGYDSALGVSSATGGETGGIDYSTSDPEAQAFFDRVNEVKQEFQSQGKSFDAVYVAAVYAILNQTDSSITYEDMAKSDIMRIANAMFSDSGFSEDTFRENLINYIFPLYLPNSKKSYESLADRVFEYYDEYQSLIGNESSSCGSVGSCVYEIKGFYFSNRGNVTSEMTITDLQVRLMQCGVSAGVQYGSGDWNTPLENEELIPFEEYILGVAYQEIGPSSPDEAIKAQMVAARSFALSRPTAMNNANGKKLAEEDGKWILQLSSCVADQVFCNPNLGCSSAGDGEQGGTVHSGTSYPKKLKDPLPADSKLRTLANDTMGEVVVNEQGYIMSTNYASNIQHQFIDLANSGLSYKQILLQVYGGQGATDIDGMSCNKGSGVGCNSTGSSGPYSGWRQTDPAWGNIPLGNSGLTIASAGCTATSVAMLIAKSGVDVNVDGDFNPGTFVQALNSIGGLNGGALNWNAVTQIAPNFVYRGKSNVQGATREQKYNNLVYLLNQGYYVTAHVTNSYGGPHWVAIDGVSGNDFLMMDPGSDATILWQEYNWTTTIEYAYYEVVE